MVMTTCGNDVTGNWVALDNGHLVIMSVETQHRHKHDYVKVLHSVTRDVRDLLKEQNHVKVNVV